MDLTFTEYQFEQEPADTEDERSPLSQQAEDELRSS
jgi:hypothetical protein